MIDVRKCEFEEAYTDDDSTVYYFTYPKDLHEAEFYSEDDYGNVVCMCISLTIPEHGDPYMAMSPTVEDGDTLCDVDWRDLYSGENYTDDMVPALIKKSGERKPA